MPTGGGKAHNFSGICVKPSGNDPCSHPLIALITPIRSKIFAIGNKALAIYSGMSSREIDIALNNALYGDYKFLYALNGSSRPISMLYLVRMKLNPMVVDAEAHCISQWGYDFLGHPIWQSPTFGQPFPEFPCWRLQPQQRHGGPVIFRTNYFSREECCKKFSEKPYLSGPDQRR